MSLQSQGLALPYGQQVRHIYSTGIGADARVLTLSGKKLVSDLKVGERLVAADVGVVRLRAISKKTMFLPDMIRISPSALFGDPSEKQVHVAPNQPIVLKGWMAKAMFGKTQVLVAANRLIDGDIYCRPEKSGMMCLYQLHFDARHLVRVNGLDMASAPMAEATATESRCNQPNPNTLAPS
ncbi:Hint domain-containing protein [Aliiroseovarius sp. KMU-50]|uniref:Hint domain-containing protein n=1 Tax=Aliiroseovarius salicola TaxID=3009082 RepID=A0ABT4W1K4_9RHOB|nr:Hint domain-containing protein [Aliiroseovarius sp. KMU-50]MDA5094385.1 Hint domain-containing protein [Aliiroseovarius sp. KMU-50]